jgi:hypothetical protein
MAAKRHRRDPRAVLEAFRALEQGGPTMEQIAAAGKRVGADGLNPAVADP